MKKNTIKILSIVSLTLLGLWSFASELNVIDDPKPNMEEPPYIKLVEVGEIPEDLGNDQYLFSPFSLTTDSQNNLYIYDNIQAKIFKLDTNFKCTAVFGKKGIGPGEFHGNSSRIPIYIKMGADGYLYASDLRGYKVIKFNTDGKFIDEYKYGRGNRKVKLPVVDFEGNIYIFSIDEDQVIRFINQKKKPLLEIGNIADVFSFLLAKPAFLEKEKGPYYRQNLEGAVKELPIYDCTASGKNLVYFPNSSSLLVGDRGRVIRNFYIWPREALENFKQVLSKEMKKSKDVVKNMFFGLFPDNQEEMFYLQMGRHEQKDINLLYCFNINGKLIKVMYVKDNYPAEFTLFRLKYGDLYMGIKNEKIKLYKEEKK